MGKIIRLNGQSKFTKKRPTQRVTITLTDRKDDPSKFDGEMFYEPGIKGRPEAANSPAVLAANIAFEEIRKHIKGRIIITDA